MSYLTMIPADSLDVGENTMHQTVMSFFPAVLPGARDERRSTSNILFSTDEDRVLIRSDIAPTRAPATAVTRLDNGVPDAGSVIRFRVTVNAVRRIRDGKTEPVLDMESWLVTKLAPALSDVTMLRHDRTLTHTGTNPLQVDVVNGQAVVADTAALEEILRVGVGRAKSYGCGLMLVAG